MATLDSTRVPQQHGFILDSGDALEKGRANSWSRLHGEEGMPKDGEGTGRHSILWMVFWTLILFLGIGAASVGPSMATIMMGNFICKLMNLPHYTELEVPLRVGAVGGAMSFIIAAFLGGILTELGHSLDARFAAGYRRAGNLSFDIDRRDGHFPVLILWIPFIFLDCLIANICGKRWQSQLTLGQLSQMAAIGGAICTPAILILGLIFWIVLERLYNFEKAKARGYTPPLESALFLKRQWEALGWLTSLPKHTYTPTPQVDH